jgi:hypothetical protein
VTWYDPHAGKYRSTLPHKIVFEFGWPVVRWIMFNCMSSERAHHVGIKGLYWLGIVDDIWGWAIFPFKIVWLFGVVLWVTYAYIWLIERSGRLMVGPKPIAW